MEKELKCLRCRCEMQFLSKEYIRFAPQSILEKGLGALAGDTLEADIYVCPKCLKLEFFTPHPIYIAPPENDPNAVICPGCQHRHEYGRTSCPHCGRQYKTCPNCGRIHDVYVSFCPSCRYEYRKSGKPKKDPWEL